MGWLSGWGCKKSHIINQQAGAGEGYQIPFKIYNSAGIDGTESIYGITMGKIFTNGKCRSDLGDVRFTESDGETLLDYWIMETSGGEYFDDVSWAGNLPVARRFIGVNDRTYLCYQDCPNGDIKMTYFDHTTKVWADAVTVATVSAGDNHRSPALEIDSNGYIHVFYGGHGVSVYVKKSTNVEDISAWGGAVTVAGSGCANMFPVIFSNDNIILFHRGSGGNVERAIKSVDGGVNWGNNSPAYDNGSAWTFLDMNPDGIYATGLIKGNGDRVHVAFYRYEYGSSLRQDVYYAYCDDEGVTWKNVDASRSDTTITKAEAESYYKVFDSGSYNVDHVRCKFDESNNPYIIIPHGGASSGTTKFATWNGSSWDIYTAITGQPTSGRWWIELETISSSIHYIYLGHDGDNTEIKEYKTVNGGVDWTNTRDLTDDGTSDDRYCSPFIVRSGYHDECKLVYMKGGAGTENHDLYYWNEETDTSIKASTAANAIFWVKISDNLSDGNATIYIYYNKSDAIYPFGADQTEMDAVFLFADHFYGDSLDLVKWNLIQGAFGIGSSCLEEVGTTGTRGKIISNDSFGVGLSVISRARWSDDNQWGQRWMVLSDGGSNYLQLYGIDTADTYNVRINNASCNNNNDVSVTDATQNIIYETRWTSAYARFLADGIQKANYTTCIPIGNLGVIYVESNIACGTIYTDFVFIRKFVDPEPTHGAFGEEDCDAPVVSSGQQMDGFVCIE